MSLQGGAQLQHHKGEYKSLGLELRDNDLLMSTEMHRMVRELIEEVSVPTWTQVWESVKPRLKLRSSA